MGCILVDYFTFLWTTGDDKDLNTIHGWCFQLTHTH